MKKLLEYFILKRLFILENVFIREFYIFLQSRNCNQYVTLFT